MIEMPKAERRTVILSRVTGTVEWKLEKVIEAGEPLNPGELMRIGFKDPRPQDWCIASEYWYIDHA